MTNAELAVLSLIAEKPRHGYEIEQVIEERGMRDWTEVGFSSIYYLLKKLEKAGMIAGETQAPPGPGPARRVYQITAAGQRAWEAATLNALSVPRRYQTPFLLGLAGLPQVSQEEALAALEKYGQALQERWDHVHTRWQASGADLPFHVEAMFDFSCTLIEAERTWVERCMNKLGGEASPSHL